MPLKPALLDQQVVGGIGNIYADEIIFESKLTPATRVGTDEGHGSGHAAIQTVLGFAVREGVAEILNGKVRPPATSRVHGQKDQPCPTCGTTIVKVQFASRGTYYCPSCQPIARLLEA